MNPSLYLIRRGLQLVLVATQNLPHSAPDHYSYALALNIGQELTSVISGDLQHKSRKTGRPFVYESIEVAGNMTAGRFNAEFRESKDCRLVHQRWPEACQVSPAVWTQHPFKVLAIVDELHFVGSRSYHRTLWNERQEHLNGLVFSFGGGNELGIFRDDPQIVI